MTKRLSTECQKEHPKNVKNSRCPGRNVSRIIICDYSFAFCFLEWLISYSLLFT